MDMTLEGLMESLEKQAGLVKQAEEDAKEDLKHEKAEDKKEGDAKAAIKEAEKDFSSLKKMNEKEESKDKKELKDEDESKEQTKEAQAAGADLANVLLQKVASVKIKQGTQMNKQASFAGKALADALLTKLANAGDVITTNGIPEGVAPNKNQIDNANMVMEQDSYIKPMPTKDAIGNGGGSINQIFDSIVADAMGQGATPLDQTPSQGSGLDLNEGAVEDSAVPGQVQTQSVEKTAAVISLVNSGVDFDSAVSMVKAAAAEIEYEEGEQVKQAAFDELLSSGVDFDLAVALVKSAGLGSRVAGKARAAVGRSGQAVEKGVAYAQNASHAAGAIAGAHARDAGEVAKKYSKAMAGNAQEGYGFAKNVVTGKDMPREVALGGLIRNRSAQVAAGGAAAAAGGAAYAMNREKKAAVSALIQAGVDFDQAVGLVQAKSDELYGA